MQGAGCRVQGAGCRVQGAGCRVQGDPQTLNPELYTRFRAKSLSHVDLMRKESQSKKTSGNKIHYTNSLILLIKIMLCSKLHYQKFLELKLFSYKMSRYPVSWWCHGRGWATAGILCDTGHQTINV